MTRVRIPCIDSRGAAVAVFEESALSGRNAGSSQKYFLVDEESRWVEELVQQNDGNLISKTGSIYQPTGQTSLTSETSVSAMGLLFHQDRVSANVRQ